MQEADTVEGRGSQAQVARRASDLMSQGYH